MEEYFTEPLQEPANFLKQLSICLNKLIDTVKNIKSDLLRYTLLMVIAFQLSIVTSYVAFDDIYITCLAASGILFLGYMGYITYVRDQERKTLEKINNKYQAIAEEVATIRAKSGRKNG